MQDLPVGRREALTLGVAALATALPRRARAGHVHSAQDGGFEQSRMDRTPVEGGERFDPVPGELLTTPYDNDPFVVEVESKLKCTCGCLHNVYECRSVDFSCGFWPTHHADIVEQATAGWTAEQIIDEYVTKHGAEYLMAPAAEGFNLIAYFLPGTLIAIVGSLLVLFLRSEARSPVAAALGSSDLALSDEDAQLLSEELEQLES